MKIEYNIINQRSISHMKIIKKIPRDLYNQIRNTPPLIKLNLDFYPNEKILDKILEQLRENIN